MPRPTYPCPECGTSLPPAARRCTECDVALSGAGVADDEPSRPHKRKKELHEEDDETIARRLLGPKAEPQDEVDVGPWIPAAITGVVMTLLVFTVSIGIFGTRGFTDTKDALTFPFLLFGGIGLVCIVWGVHHVRSQDIRGRFGNRTTGSGAVVAGYGEILLGALVAGVCLYGLIFKYLVWIST